MSIINVRSTELANLIAAGEVIERPGSKTMELEGIEKTASFVLSVTLPARSRPNMILAESTLLVSVEKPFLLLQPYLMSFSPLQPVKA